MSGHGYIRIPGTQTHELPPLLVHGAPDSAGEELTLASILEEAEDMLAEVDADEQVREQRKFELALNLAKQYRSLIGQWLWGDSIIDWIRQCEITFERHERLRELLHPDVWPHAGRSSFVTLLEEKRVPAPVAVERAVGLRLTFRQPPPIDCFSNQFLMYLNSPVADSAYQAWAHLNSAEQALLPPERFHFEVLDV